LLFYGSVNYWECFAVYKTNKQTNLPMCVRKCVVVAVVVVVAAAAVFDAVQSAEVAHCSLLY
jgi:hypothetical protein